MYTLSSLTISRELFTRVKAELPRDKWRAGMEGSGLCSVVVLSSGAP